MFGHSNGSGKVFKDFFIGDEKLNDSSAYLKTAVDNYNMALSVFQTGAILKVLEVVKGYTFVLNRY